MASKLDELNKLEPKQQAGVLIGAIVTVYVLFSFGLIGDLDAQAQGKLAEAGKLKKEVQALKKKLAGPTKTVNPENDPKVLGARLKHYKSQLPLGDDYTGLMKWLKKLADQKGLKLPQIKQGDVQTDNYVKYVPITFKATGKFPGFIKFLTEMSREGNRIITLESFSVYTHGIKHDIPKGIFTQLTGAAADRMTDDGRKRALIRQLDAYEAAARKSQITVEFTIRAYYYTGVLLTEEQIKKRKKRRH